MMIFLQGTAYNAYKVAASKIDDAKFVVTSVPAVAKAAGVETLPGVGIMRNFQGACLTPLPPEYISDRLNNAFESQTSS